jgi:arylsulfatase A-like enzyme
MFAAGPGRTGTAGRSRGPGWRRAVRNGYHQRLDSLLAVDDAVARTIRTLRHTRQLSRTIVVFTSDNGFMTGQHDQYGKLLFYDDSLRIPVAMAGPSIPRHHTVRSPITNPDLATTFAAIAGARPGRRQDGIDVRPLMHGGYRARPIPIEAYPVHGGTRPVYTGIRYADLTYVRLRHGVEELYDRTTDPYELVNVAHRPAYRSALTQMRRWRHLYRRCAGRGCRQQLQSWPAQTAVP